MKNDWSIHDIAVEKKVPEGDLLTFFDKLINDPGVINWSRHPIESYACHREIIEVFCRQAKQVPYGVSTPRVINIIGLNEHVVILADPEMFDDDSHFLKPMAAKEKALKKIAEQLLNNPSGDPEADFNWAEDKLKEALETLSEGSSLEIQAAVKQIIENFDKIVRWL